MNVFNQNPLFIVVDVLLLVVYAFLYNVKLNEFVIPSNVLTVFWKRQYKAKYKSHRHPLADFLFIFDALFVEFIVVQLSLDLFGIICRCKHQIEWSLTARTCLSFPDAFQKLIQILWKQVILCCHLQSK